jgi:peptidoglycan/LPS O-acetylase OafA/YrhL
MRSSDGHHWVALDHIRALAALLVFSWHFLHGPDGHPVPFAGAPSVFPLALFDEGHTGVSLFMVLSGYLFAKLLAGKDVHYGAFFWNRLLRLAPLLVVVIILAAVQESAINPEFRILHYARAIASGLWRPVLPNGGWSITVEAHFYLILPFLMLATRKWPIAPLGFLIAAIALRMALYTHYHEIESLAYWTIVGRIDQFLLGIFAFQQRDRMRREHLFAFAIALVFVGYFFWFDVAGGFYQLGGHYPSTSRIWIIEPTIEGACYAALVAYYDTSFTFTNTGLSRAIGMIGAYSYSIYLLHVFFVFKAAEFINAHLLKLSNFYVALAACIPCFLAMAAIASITYNYIEKPFLRFRVPYVKRMKDVEVQSAIA